MSELDSIPVFVDGAPGPATHSGNLGSLMLQVEQALQDLQGGGSGTVIDLTAMPFSNRDEETLRERLGQGEVRASLDAFGPTLIEETALSGVWLVEHKDAEGRRLALHLEVTRVPAILVTPEADIADGLAVLRAANQAEQIAQDDAGPERGGD